jgi:ribosomal protein S18 acetylase RimI-like enzyme
VPAIPERALYDRMLANLVSCWTRIAEGVPAASVERLPRVVIARFPEGPERAFYNNAVLDRGLDASAAAEAAAAALDAYEEAEVERFAIWAHESETASIDSLAGLGLRVDTTTLAMSMSLADLAGPAPEIDLVPPDWDEYLRVMELPEGTLEGVDPQHFHVIIGRLGGDSVSAALAYDHEGDCGIYNLGTLARARRRGIGSAVTALHLHRARERGCETASLQSTAMAEGVYAGLGFRGLGRFIEYSR